MTAHILIVDDEPSIVETMGDFLALAGYQTSVAATAEEALTVLAAHSIDVVITDIMLPGMDGLALTDRIKSNWDADVIVMTGYSQQYSYEEAVNKGASDFVFKPVRFEELHLRLKRVLRERALNQERVQMMQALKKLSITDALTGLYNARHFYEQIKTEMDRFNRYGHELSLLLLDIDRFKVYNDTYGHLEGDKILAGIAQVIRSCLRKLDTAYRYGGEEFVVVLPETSGEEAHTVAERIRSAVADEPFPAPGHPSVCITVSIGVTQYLREEPVSRFVQRADAAMYQSKQAGRNQVCCIFQPLPEQPDGVTIQSNQPEPPDGPG